MVTQPMSELPTLRNLFSAYFHQDWPLDHASPDAVIDDYRTGEAPVHVRQALQELEALLAQPLDDAALGARVHALGCEYDPTRDAVTWRAWLQSVALRLRATA